LGERGEKKNEKKKEKEKEKEVGQPFLKSAGLHISERKKKE
jgi:hypothetical protein